MVGLYNLSGDDIRILSPTSFMAQHREAHIQHWADVNPHFLNDGMPMLSLGREVITHHNHGIDNLYLDGNACLVVAEMKRGQSPRDVTAQVIDYGAYASGLDWDDLEPLCQKRHETDLDTAFQNCFGRPLVKPEKIEHRLLVMAENYDQRVLDAALYLINTGTPLTLLQFTYFEIDGVALFNVESVLGEIPAQLLKRIGAKASTAATSDGYNTWLFTSVANELPEIAKRQSWEVQCRINKQSLAFVNDHWPTAFGGLQMILATWRKDSVTFWVYFTENSTPGLRAFLEQNSDRWHNIFPGEFQESPRSTEANSLLYRIPLPEMGDTEALADILDRTEKMTEAIIPVIGEFFEKQGSRGT